MNNNVFKDPAGVMENIFGVTEYLEMSFERKVEIRTERHFPALRQRMDVPISRIMRDSRGDVIIIFRIRYVISL